MTEQIKSAIKYGTDYYKDLIGACCDVSDKHKEYIRISNNSLKAWEEVLKELETEKNKSYESWGVNYLGLKRAIDIINQHLSEIEE